MTDPITSLSEFGKSAIDLAREELNRRDAASVAVRPQRIAALKAVIASSTTLLESLEDFVDTHDKAVRVEAECREVERNVLEARQYASPATCEILEIIANSAEKIRYQAIGSWRDSWFQSRAWLAWIQRWGRDLPADRSHYAPPADIERVQKAQQLGQENGAQKGWDVPIFLLDGFTRRLRDAFQREV